MMILLSFFLIASTPAEAGAVDEYASRYDWACTFGKDTTTCGGPDTWEGVEAAHTVLLCGAEPSLVECGHTWRVGAKDEEALRTAMVAWGKAAEADLRSSSWVSTPASNPDVWMAALRSRDRVAALEVGRAHVQIRVEDRKPCTLKEIGGSLRPFVEPVLPESTEDAPLSDAQRAEMATAAPWPETATMAVGTVNETLAVRVISRPPQLGPIASDVRARWTLLASEPFQCLMETRGAKSTREVVPMALAEWRKFVAPTKTEAKELRLREREQARMAKKREQVETTDETLSDEVAPREGPSDDNGLDDVDVDDLIGEDE